ncbi:hypothetical protein SAMN05216388_101340 [Halorientalis persicus]|uniref:Uncharacterized protein n=1 Tax=Halorientalis persicus TaxID=1367881 RepID=A0A1H8Q2W4_9EURY|nr:hypothetical protein [Halorientalis persicus]SEO48338.1 hypothetical protein SAMN05216388_101340 [Halorientalis persicus]
MSIHDSAEATDEQIEIKSVECEFYRACTGPAQYEFEALVFNAGVQQVQACPSCTAEFLAPERNRRVAEVRKLDPAERWEATDGN